MLTGGIIGNNSGIFCDKIENRRKLGKPCGKQIGNIGNLVGNAGNIGNLAGLFFAVIPSMQPNADHLFFTCRTTTLGSTLGTKLLY